MPRRQNRVTSRGLELAGVQGAPGPDVSDDIQLTYLLGDLSGLMPPLPLNTIYWDVTRAAVAALYSGMDIRSPADSCIEILYLENYSAIDGRFRLTSTLNGNEAPSFQTMEDPLNVATRCTLRTGTRTVPLMGIGIGAGVILPPNIFPIRLSPGNPMVIFGDVVNTDFAIRMVWREVAFPAPTL